MTLFFGWRRRTQETGERERKICCEGKRPRKMREQNRVFQCIFSPCVHLISCVTIATKCAFLSHSRFFIANVLSIHFLFWRFSPLSSCGENVGNACVCVCSLYYLVRGIFLISYKLLVLLVLLNKQLATFTNSQKPPEWSSSHFSSVAFVISI